MLIYLMIAIGLAGLLGVGLLTPRFFWGLFLTGLRSLETHFLRSLLATLGVLIGVGSVVACMSIMEGFSNNIIRQFKSLGSNVLYIMPAAARIEGRPVGVAQTLVLGDVETLLRELPDDIEAIAPEALGSTTVRRFQKSGEYTVVATTDDYFVIHDYKAAQGRVFSHNEVTDELATLVCLGSKVAEDLFGGEEAIGQPIKVGNAVYRVVGVLQKKGSLGFLNADESIFIPVKAGMKRFFNREWFNRMTVLAKNSQDLEEVQKRITSVLRNAHNIPIGDEPDFRTFNQQEAMTQVSQALFVGKAVFYSIAGISLIVGGIGIMNIMLVSVTERTREIGVRMAVGARRGDILLQFLVEALVISSLGGGFGLLLGAMCADVISQVLRDFNFVTEISAFIIFVALATTTSVGVLSGLYPAFKAARLDPVEALRYE
jgi:putative ABC transport system permease protein